MTMGLFKEQNDERSSVRKFRYRGRYANEGRKLQVICWRCHQRVHKKTRCNVDPSKEKEANKEDLVFGIFGVEGNMYLSFVCLLFNVNEKAWLIYLGASFSLDTSLGLVHELC